MKMNYTMIVVCIASVLGLALVTGGAHEEIPGVELVTTEVTEETTVPVLEPTLEPLDIVFYDCPLDFELQQYIKELCDIYGVDMATVLALIYVESSFRPDIVSKSNDYGLMQINSINHEWLREKYGITDFLDPYQNVFCGIAMLSEHLVRYEDETKALMAYHYGAGGAKRLWNEGVYATEYTNRILEIKEIYDNEIK